MSKLRVLDLFSGIGGFSLGLERTGGFETVAFCEIEPFPRRVLAKHWPGVPSYEDVRTVTADILRRDGIAVDVITGGFPCQDLSVAGKRAGLAGERSGLWSEIARLVGELRPKYIVVENVANLLSGPPERRGGWFGRVLGDLACLGYDAEWEIVRAADVGAPHSRARVWLVAHPAQLQRDGSHDLSALGLVRQALSEPGNGGRPQDVANADGHHAQGVKPGCIDTKIWAGQIAGQAGSLLAGLGGIWGAEPDVGRVADGVPDRSHRLAALGNAVVPQIAELIGYSILWREAASRNQSRINKTHAAQPLGPRAGLAVAHRVVKVPA